MRRYAAVLLAVMAAVVFASCSVVSRGMRQEAGPPVPFSEIIAEAAKMKGKTVILGGYIIETLNRQDDTVMTVLQVPLGMDHTPRGLALTEGRFKIIGKGFLDPELFARGRPVTVAGVVEGVEVLQVGQAEVTYLIVTAREIHVFSDVHRHEDPYPVCCPGLWYPHRGHGHWYPPHHGYW